MHYSSLIACEHACVAFIVSVTISKAIVIRSFIFHFHCSGRVIACRFTWWDAIFASGKKAKRHMSWSVLRYHFADASRRVMARMTLKLARRTRRLPDRYLAKRTIDETSLIAPSNSTATPINKYKRPPFAGSIVSEDKLWAHTLAKS